MAPRLLWSALALLALLNPALAIENDYSFYPEGSQDCLYQAADTAGCTNGTITELNSCQCKNENDFVIIAAKCIGKNDYADVDEVYSDMSEACDNSETSLSVTEEEFKAAAEEGRSASSSATDSATTSAASSTISASATESAYVTTTSGGKTITVVPTQTNDHDGDEESSGLSTTATIGIGVGAAAAGAAVVGALFFFCFRRNRNKKPEEDQMLLRPYQGNSPSPYPHTDAQNPAAYFDPKHTWAGSTTPSPNPSKDWASPIPPQYTGPYSAPIAELPPQTVQAPGQVFEMDGGTTHYGGHGGNTDPVEMPGSEIRRSQALQKGAWENR